MRDLTETEAASWMPLAGLILVLGLLPGLLLNLTNPAVERALSDSANTVDVRS
jgi:NADH:ubiquinone oxidoreductase subunit 4 (subunit M)